MTATFAQHNETHRPTLSNDEMEQRRLSIQKQWSPVELRRRAELARVRTEELVSGLFSEDYTAQSA